MDIIVKVILIKNDQVLLGEKWCEDHSKYELYVPGGKKLPNESLITCLRRQMNDDFGVDLRLLPLEQVAVISHYTKAILSTELHVFRCMSYEGDTSMTSDTIPRWFSLDSLSRALDQLVESDRDWFMQAVWSKPFVLQVYTPHTTTIH
jgi:ADP-ribose pyrophosphatase YjhB (NUDIX family)